MYIIDADITLKLSQSEAWTIAVALIATATENESHWKQYGYSAFIDQNSDSIKMARMLASLTNSDYIDAQLQDFKGIIEAKS